MLLLVTIHRLKWGFRREIEVCHMPSLAAALSARWQQQMAVSYTICFLWDSWEWPFSKSVYETNWKACASLFPERSSSLGVQRASALAYHLVSFRFLVCSASEIQVRERGRKQKSAQEFCFLLVQETFWKPPALAKQEVKLNRDLHPCSWGGLFLHSVL